jgi:hypothetical protein
VFIDSDKNAETGLHYGDSKAGIDYMVENNNLWKYTGTHGEWSWEFWGELEEQQFGRTDPSRLEFSILRSKINNTEDNRTISIVFNINNNDPSADDYAPDDYQNTSYLYTFSPTDNSNEQPASIPSTFNLRGYPNPFNSEIVISFNTACGCGKNLKAEIFDINGRRIKNYSGKDLGTGRIVWKGKDKQNNSLGSGTYFFRLTSDENYETIKMTMLK